jgi:GalNAc-alpha-(1->4)-GalNAc-alpha-(1->3)-diNAcBac-PP-undecaprenol alpha-1,4-N-acetyl-D-galactosaminyltransferase
LHIGFVIFSLRVGGAERVAATLTNEWARRGEQVTLLTIDSRDTDFYPIDARVRRVGLGLNIPAKNWRHSAANNARRVRLLRTFAGASKFDAIVSFGDKTNVLLLLATRGVKVPIIVAEHTDPRKYSVGAMAGYLRRLLYPRASAVVVLTPEIGQWARQFVRSEAVRIIPNPVGEQCLTRLLPAVRGRQHFVLGMGRMGFEKGFDLLLRAFALCAEKFPDWTLRLVGQGEEQQRLRNLAEQLRIQHAVRFEPVTKEPERVLRESDLFVLSSRLEGFPMMLLEAMACGLPVVSFDCMSGPSEMIRHGIDGFLVPPEDVGALANAMEMLMGNEYERKRLSERAGEVTERFGLPRVMGMWSEVLTNVTERHCVAGRRNRQVNSRVSRGRGE